jgi:replicative DNA helicase
MLILPHNHDAELATLGCLLLQPNIFPDIKACLVPDSFYDPTHRKIYRAMLRIDNQDNPIDYVTLTEELKKQGQLKDIGGVGFLSSLTDYVATAANFERYRDIVCKDYTLRRLIELGGRLAQSCYDDNSLEEIFNDTEKALLSINQGDNKNTVRMASDGIMSVLRDIENKDDEPAGLNTGFRDLDFMTGGLRPGQLIVIAGRPGMGKTSLALNIATNIAVKSPEKPQEGRSVLLFSIEMSYEEILHRALSDVSGVSSHKIRNRKCLESDMADATYGAKKLYNSFLAVDDSAGLTPAKVLSRARRFKSKHGLSLVVVDYLQLMSPGTKTDNETGSISYISKQMKLIARELEAPVILLSQLSRKCEDTPDKKPQLSSLRGSGSIEQDADIVGFVYRPSYYGLRDKGGLLYDNQYAELIIAKQRNGVVGTIDLKFLGQFTRFEDR